MKTKTFTRKIAAVAAGVVTLTVMSAGVASASPLTLNGLSRSCAEGVRPVAQGINLDAHKFSNGTILVDGSIKDPCTDGQYALIYMRQISMSGTPTTDWTWVRTGSSAAVRFEKWMPTAGLVSDVQVKVCRTGADPACSSSRYLHV